MKIIKMVREDLIEVTRLAEQLGYPNSVEEIAERFDEITNDPHYAIFVAKAEGKVLGWIQINHEPKTLLLGPRADIAALVVDENSRSQGLGKALILRAEEWARENNVPLVRVRSNSKREAAHRFYQREGYTLSKTSHIFVKKI